MYFFLLKIEAIICSLVQDYFEAGEPLWILLSEHFTAARIMDIFVPLVGIFHHQLLVRLVCSLGVINALSSLLKWCLPENRPFWWTLETDNDILRQFPLTCETTSGFPSSHSMCFTIFIYLISIITFVACCRKYGWSTQYVYLTCFPIVMITSFSMWLSRMYLGTQFLHQCFLSFILAFTFLRFFDQHVNFFFTLSRFKTVLAVLLIACIPIVSYFAMLFGNVDPHWSVRMAFKWCEDPSLLRHEASPIFLLGRDFGFLLGIALSAPLYKRYDCQQSMIRRILVIFAIEALNYYARLETPKDYGRFAFVGFECLRNVMHSYSLLTIVSKIP